MGLGLGLGDHLPPFELRVVREEAREHPTHPVAEPRVEVVQDELRAVARGRAVASDLLRHHERRQLEASRRAVRQLDHPQAGDRRLLRHDALLGVVLDRARARVRVRDMDRDMVG